MTESLGERRVENECRCEYKREKLRPTHRLCTLVSTAIRLGLTEFGLPGSPYGTAKEIELVSENCSLKS